MKRTYLVSAGAGLIFGIGLVLAGMTQPAKVVGFLDFAGAWDPSLALVMAGAIGVYLPIVWLIRRRGSTLGGSPLLLPSRTDLDGRLIIGAAIFGVGWGIGGVCPGPAIASLGAGSTNVILLVAAMAVGMFLHQLVDSQGKDRASSGMEGEADPSMGAVLSQPSADQEAL